MRWRKLLSFCNRVWCRAVHTTEPKKKKKAQKQKPHNLWSSFLKVLNYKIFYVSWDLRWQMMQTIIQNNTNLNILSNTFNPSWLVFMKHLKACLHPSHTVDRVCADMEIMVLNDHHLQAQTLKRVLLLNSVFFTRSASKMAQRMIRQQWETAVLVFWVFDYTARTILDGPLLCSRGVGE